MTAGGFDFVLAVHPGSVSLLHSTVMSGDLRPAQSDAAGLFHQAMDGAPHVCEFPRHSPAKEPHPDRRTSRDSDGNGPTLFR